MARVFIFSHDMSRLYAELKCRTSRSWRLNASDEQFGIATAFVSVSEPLLSPELLQFRNVLWIHDGVLPDWVGQIGEPQNYSQSEIGIGAKAYEAALGERWIQARLNGGPGAVFRQLISDANAVESLNISLGDVDDGGRDVQIGRQMSVLQGIQAIQRKTRYEWGIDASLPEGAAPVLSAWFRQKTGTDYSGSTPHIDLDEHTNIEFDPGNMIMVKFGRVYNHVRIYAASGNQEDSAIGEAFNRLSVDQYGLSQYVTSEPLKTDTLTQKHAESEASSRATPKVRFAITVNDSTVFPYLRIGNSFNLILRTVGWQNGARGWTGPVRVIGMAYDDMENKVALTLQEVTD